MNQTANERFNDNSQLPSATPLITASKKPKPVSTPPRLWVSFPVDLLPKPLRLFAVEGAKATGVDCVMYVMPMLAVCAAAIGTTRRLQIKRTWKEPAILWLATVARSGQVKSPPFDDAIQPLEKRDSRALLDHEDALLNHKADVARWEVASKEWKNRGSGEPPLKPEKPEPPRLITTDATTEAIALLLSHNPRGLLLARDELSGWFGSHNAYRGGHGSDVPYWLQMHRGKSLTIDRKTDKKLIHCDHAAVSICGTIQPRILRRVLTQEHFEAGLAARLLLAMPPGRPKRWTDSELSEDAELVYDHIIGRLLSLQHNTGHDGAVIPADIQFTSEARQAFIGFYDRHGLRQDTTQEDDLAAAFAKLEAVAARLALIFHCIHWANDDLDDPDFIGMEDITAAIAITEWFINETRRVYQLFGEDEGTVEASELIDWIIRRGGEVTARDLQMNNRRYRPSDAAVPALDNLEQRGWGQWEYDKPDSAGGRPSRRFVVASDICVNDTSADDPASVGFVDNSAHDKNSGTEEAIL